MGIWDKIGEGLKDVGRKTPLVQDFFDNPEQGQKDQAFADAAKAFEGAQGQSDQRHQQTLQQSLAYFQPIQRLLGEMYGFKDPSQYAQFFAPPPQEAGFRGTAPSDNLPNGLQTPSTPPMPAPATWKPRQ